MAWLVELLIPVGAEASTLDDLQRRLAAAFGGVTVYSRAPAKGRWRPGDGREEADDVVLVEVMAETLDRAWWKDLRGWLEWALGEEEVVVRAHAIERL